LSEFYICGVKQKFKVVWNEKTARSFPVQKSIRQGGVLSPHFFNVYMDGLSIRLTSLVVGCKVGKKFSNKIWSADDLVLLAPTVTALQQMIVLCHEYAKRNICFSEKNCMHEIRFF